LLQQLFEVVFPALILVILGDFNRKGLLPSDMPSQPSEGGPSGPTDSDQKSISSWGLEDSANLGDVVNSVSEKDQIHGFGGADIIKV